MARWAPVVVFALALGLRLVNLGGPSFWLDEGFSLGMAEKPVAEIWELTRTYDIHSPLFYWGLHHWQQWVPRSEFWLRLPQALAGALACSLAFVTGRRLGGNGSALAVAIVCAVSHYLFLFEQECRMYAWVFLAESGYLLALVALLQGPAPYWGGLLVTSAVLGSYMDYRFGLLAALAGSHALWLADAPSRRALLIWLSLGAAACIPLVPWFLHQTSGAGSGTSLALSHPPLTLELLLSQIPAMAGGWYWEPPVLVLLPATLSWFGLLLWRWRVLPKAASLLVTSFLGSWAFLIAYSLMRNPVYSLHSSLTLAYPFLITTGLLLARLPHKATGAALAAWLTLNGLSLVRTHLDPTWNKQNWRQVAQALRSLGAENDQVVLIPAYQSNGFFFYWKPPRWVTLNPRDFLDPALEKALLKPGRSWFVLAGDRWVDRSGYVRQWMDRHLRIEQAYEMPNAPFYEICGRSIQLYCAVPKGSP